MTALRVVATLDGPITLTDGTLRIDALAMWAKAQVEGLPPPGFGPLQEVDIPIDLSKCGRFYMCSFAAPRFEQHQQVFVNRRFPATEAQDLGEPGFNRIRISAGPQKSYRIPQTVGWVEHDQVEWWCLGEPNELRKLLGLVTHLGRRRAVGRGRVRAWTVDQCEPWGYGFPVIRDGQPLRSLPIDYPGLINPSKACANLKPPYWEHHREELCAVPLPS